MDNIDWNTAIVSIVIAFIVFVVTQLLTGYLREKGTNYATKQDVEEITDKVESVKIEYSKEIEKLRSDLQVMVGNHSLIQEKRNEAIINFFEDCMILLNEKLLVNFGDFPADQGESFMEYEISTNHIFTKIYSDFYRLFLYFDSEDPILVSSNKMIRSIQEIRNIFKHNFSTVKLALLAGMDVAGGKPEIFHKKMDKADMERRKYYEKMNPAIESMKNDLNEYVSVLNNYFKKLGYEESVKDVTP